MQICTLLAQIRGIFIVSTVCSLIVLQVERLLVLG